MVDAEHGKKLHFSILTKNFFMFLGYARKKRPRELSQVAGRNRTQAALLCLRRTLV
jgi:hypothetical protein